MVVQELVLFLYLAAKQYELCIGRSTAYVPRDRSILVIKRGTKSGLRSSISSPQKIEICPISSWKEQEGPVSNGSVQVINTSLAGSISAWIAPEWPCFESAIGGVYGVSLRTVRANDRPRTLYKAAGPCRCILVPLCAGKQ